MIFIYVILMVVVAAVVVFGISLIVGLIVARGVPFISSPKKDFKAILEAADIKPGEVVYDLGCGRASFLIAAAKKCEARGVGYEISLLPYIWARFNIWLSRANVAVHFKNFHKADISGADVVFCYLFPEVMEKLEPKFEKELKPGARLVSYAFSLTDREPTETFFTRDDNTELGRIFVYIF